MDRCHPVHEVGQVGPQIYYPFRVISRVARVAYRLEFLEELNQIHNTFHISQSWKCLVDDSIVVPLEDIQTYKCLNYRERPVVILDKKSKTLRNKVVNMVKVQWQN